MFKQILQHEKFSINEEGIIQDEKGKILKPRVSLKGCKVRLGKKSFKISDLIDSTFQKVSTEEDINNILRKVGWLWKTRLMWRSIDGRVDVKLLYQNGGGGILEREEFSLNHYIDALLIFKDGSPLKNKWTRSYTKPRRGA